MAHVHIEGIAPYDGDWELDPERFTNSDLRTIKKISGLRPPEVMEALYSDDVELVVAFAVIALDKAGKRPDERILWDAKTGKISLVFDEEEAEDDADPPSQTPSEPAEPGSDNANGSPSGTGSRSDGATEAEKNPSPTGFPRLAESTISDREISAV